MEPKRDNFDDNLSVIMEDLSNEISTKYKFIFVDKLDKKIGKVHFEFEEFTSITDEKLKSIGFAASECENDQDNFLKELKNISKIDRNKKFDRFLSAVISICYEMKGKNCSN